jgi:stage IV sporulation protein FB
VGYLDRQYDDFDTADRGPVRRFFDRIFENVENPLGWSLKMFTLRGIATRIHIFTVAFMLAELLRSIPQSNAGVAWMAMAMGSLFVLVLLHEFGHCFACRRVGGEADRIVMLPFGGLALVRPPHTWKASLITTIGGPAVNVVFLPITSIALILLGRPDAVLFNPFDFAAVLSSDFGTGSMYWVRMGVWWLHAINIVLLLLNLMPSFPLDGGRIVQALLWRSKGYRQATEIAVLIGYFGAGLMALLAILFEAMLLLFIAVFAFWACWAERRRLRSDVELAGPSYGVGLPETDPDDESEPAGPSRAERKQQERDERDAEELDRLLAKISESGMDSLSGAERRRLDRLSKKRRSG